MPVRYYDKILSINRKIFQRKRHGLYAMTLSFSLDLMPLTIRGIAVQLPLIIFYIGISNYVLLFAPQSCLRSISVAEAKPWRVFPYHLFHDSFLQRLQKYLLGFFYQNLFLLCTCYGMDSLYIPFWDSGTLLLQYLLFC